MIAEMLGVPAGDRGRFRLWSVQHARLLEPTACFRDRAIARDAQQEFDAYFRAVIALRRSAPRDDIPLRGRTVEVALDPNSHHGENALPHDKSDFRSRPAHFRNGHRAKGFGFLVRDNSSFDICFREPVLVAVGLATLLPGPPVACETAHDRRARKMTTKGMDDDD